MQDFVITNCFFDSRYCANLKPLLTMDFQSPITFNGDSPLHVAVRQGQIEDVREILIQQQADVNILNSKQETPLHLACSKRDSPIVQLLVAFGADPYIEDSNDYDAHDRSSFNVSQLMDKLLFGHGLRLWIGGPVQADKESPLHTAVRLGRLDDIQRIIEEKNVDIDDTNANHETPLHLACALGNKYIVHILISNGANIYMKDFFNNAPIHRAVSQGQIDTVDYLITVCACNPNIKGYQGRTLLHFACGVGNVKFATTLIEKYDISPMATDAVEQTPLHIAASHGQEEVVCLLINKYSSLESTDLPRLLWLACSCGHVSVVRTLVLKYKADIDEIDVIDSSVMGGSIEMVQLMITEFDLDPLSVDDDGNTLLHMACRGGHEELARLLITNYNCPVDVKNEDNETPLHIACLSGHSNIVRMLVSEFKADATQRDDNNDTAVSKAAEGGHVETVRALITELGCSPKVTGYHGRSLLHEACWSGSIKLAEMLIIEFSLDIFLADDNGDTPLHMACWGGHEELARLLITKYNCPVDVKSNIQETPLHCACSSGHSSIVRMLISEFKADATQRDHNNDTAVSKAAEGGHVATVRALITELGRSPKVRSLLHEACQSGSIKLVEMLIIDFCLDVWSADDSGDTPLHTACRYGHEELAKLLITKYNCPVDVKNKIQETPVHYARSNGHSSIVRMLLLTMDFQCPKTFNGDSLLHVAIRQGQIEDVREILIQQLVDVNILNSKHETPLHLACSKRDSPIVQLLVAFGADPLIQDSNYENAYDRSRFDTQQLINKLLYSDGLRLWIDGPVQADKESPLHTAVRLGRVDDVQRMIEEKIIDINDTNANHETPLHLACVLGHKHIVHILISNGADIYMKDIFNNAPIHRAVSQGQIDTVDYLITVCACNPNIKGYQGRILLHFACAIGNIKLVTTLIEKYGISPMDTDAVDQTPLHIAASHGQEEVVCLLINKYSSLESTDLPRLLWLACSCGHVSVVRTLVLKYKADIDEIDVIDSSVMGGSIEMVQLMITEFDLDPLSVDDDGNTLLHMACRGGHEELARLLITNYNCPVDVKNEDNETPLHIACLSGHSNIVRMLVSEFKADATQRDDNNDTAVSKAAEGGHVETVRALITELGCSLKVTGYHGRSLLHEACWSGSIKLAEMLIIEFSLDIFLADDNGDTPLHMACWGGHEELARLLITKYNSPVDVKNNIQETPLHIACSSGHGSIVRMLISEFKADGTQRDHNYDTAVSIAARGGHVETVQVLITELGCSKVTGYDGRSLLHEACWSGNIKLVEMLIIDFSLDVLSADASGNTPLHMACLGGHEELARLLITKYNCPVDVKNKDKETPLHKACSSGHSSMIVGMLVSEFKADATQRDCNYDDTAVSKAAKDGHVETVQALITELGSSLKVTGYDGRSLLHEACWSGSIKLAEMLIIDFSLDVMSADDCGNTPLHMACLSGHEELARLLITKCNYPVNINNEENETPLHLACSSGHLSVVRMLISEFKADKNARNYQSSTPLCVAVLNEQASIVQMLITEFDCSPQVKGFEGRSLLHFACKKGHTKLAVILMTDFKLDPLSADDSGNTPLHMACMGGHKELARLLITKYDCPVDIKNRYEQTTLHMACIHGHLGVSKVLISECMVGGDKRFYNALDRDNNTPLDLLIKRRDAKAVHILYKKYGLKPHVRGVESKPLLHQLAAGGFTTVLQKLIYYDPACSDEDGNTILHTSAQHGRYKITKFLITNYSNQVSIDCRNSRGQTALHCACIGGHTEVAKLLVDNKADITVRDEDGDTPLKKAFLTGNEHILFQLFNFFFHTEIDSNLLLQACECGYVNLIDVLLSDFHLNPSSILDDQGNKAIHIAALRGHKQVAILLVKKYNCPVDVKNKAQRTPLHMACSRGQLDVSIVLVSGGNCNTLDKDDNTPLDLLIKRGDTNAVHILFTKYGLRPHIRDVESKPLLHQLAAGGFTTVLQELISKFNYDPACSDENKNTILHIAAQHGQYEIAEFVITNHSNQFPMDHRNCQGLTALHCACMHGYARIVKLIANKALGDKDEKALVDDYGNTLLHIAAQHGQHEIAELLFTDYSNQCPIDHRNSQGQTALHCAYIGGHTRVAKLLVDNGAGITVRDEDDDAPLKKAFLTGHERTFFGLFNSNLHKIDDKLLLQVCERGYVNLIDVLLSDFHLDPFSVLDDEGNKPIHIAALLGHEQVVTRLIEKYKCPVNIENEDKQTPLHMACSLGQLGVSIVLVSECEGGKKFCNALDKDSNTPLDILIKRRDAEAVHILSTKGCKPHVRGVESKPLLHQLAAGGFTTVLQELITNFNYDPVCSDEDGNTILHTATQHGQYEIAKFLIASHSSQLSIDHRNSQGQTALHCACIGGHTRVAKFLVDNKADITIRDEDGDTPLKKAFKTGHVLTLFELFDSNFHTSDSKLLRQVKIIANKQAVLGDKAEEALVDDCGNTLLHVAAQHGQYEIAELLIADYSNLCPIDHRNSQGQTALHCACIGGHTRVAKFLIANKADITVRDEDDDTPLKKAFLKGHEPTFFELFNSNLRKIDDKLLLQVCERGYVNLIDVLLSDFHLDPSSVLDDEGNKAIHIAALLGHEQIVTLLVKKYNCPVNDKNKYKQTPLHMACSLSQLDVSVVLVSECEGGKKFCNALDKDSNTPLDILIKRRDHAEAVHILSTEYGLKPHVRDVESKPLLHQLAAGGFKTVLQELISKFNHDPACPDEDGNTILHTAAEHGQYTITEFLITNYSNQCPIDHKNRRGLSALHYACMRGHVRIVKLIANKALGDKDEKVFIDEYDNTLLHIAAQHGQYEIAELLIAEYGNQCQIDSRNTQGQTALHCACIGGHTRIAKFLMANKADITVRDKDGHGDTPLKKAFLTGHERTFFELFNSNLRTIDSKLLRQVCERGSIDLIYVLLSDFHLDSSSVLDDQGNKAVHVAASRGHKEVIAQLVKKYDCPIDSRNLSGQTPLHLLCSQSPTENGHALIRMCVSEFKADVSTKDANDDQPIHVAVQAGHTSTVISLIVDLHVSPNSLGFKKRSLLHHALANGHNLTAKTLTEKFHLSLHCVDEDGNTPLHLSSLAEQTESVRFLLYEYHAPVYVRNKAGKTALNLATEDSTKEVIREYITSEHKRIQHEYEELRAKSLQKYSGQQCITRVFILGNPGSGKSTLVESLKRTSRWFSSLFTVTEADVPPRTAGIVPSVQQSRKAGRLLYYDFAGDREYYSSHASILEIISDLTVGSNVCFIVADLRKDNVIIHNEIGYWLSFVAYHGKALDSKCRLKIILILSHSDRLSSTDCVSKVESMRQYYLHDHKNQYEIFNIIKVVSSNCSWPYSTRSIKNILQQISKDTPPCSISYEASLLHGLLEKDFSNAIACKFQDLLSHIKDTGICLPTIADSLFPIVKELHDIGLLMMIGHSEDTLENYLLLLDLSSLTHEVHQNLFSKSAMEKFSSPNSPQYANMGILPESHLARLLPKHITKECLVQLQYCQEFTCADVGLHNSEVSKSTSEKTLLYFPALCKLDSEQSNWPNDPLLNFSIGWYAKCTGKLDYFPSRFLHVLLLRLAFAFALPIANCKITESNEISAQNRRCTMWKNGIHWLMEEGVECIFEMVNDNKGMVIITKSEKDSNEWANILSEIISKILQAKADFCSIVSLHHFLLKSDDISSFMNEDKLFEITAIESVIKEGKKKVASVSGRKLLDLSHLDNIFRKYTFGGKRLSLLIILAFLMMNSVGMGLGTVCI